MVYHNLKALIKGIRACKTLADERALIQNESAAIRTSFKEEDTYARHNNIAKLLYIHMLGYPAHFGQIECLKLVASPRFSDKRLGYLGIMLLLDENQEVLTLVTNSLKNDMNHSNMYAVGLALCTFANISSEEMSRDLSHEIEKLLGSTNTYIRKKAALCALRVVRRVPDLLENYVTKAKALLSDRNHGVLLSGITLISEMCQMDQNCLDEFRKAVPLLVRHLKSLVTTGYSPEHDVSGITDPFLQVKILRLLRLLGKGDVQASETMNDILAQVATNTDSSKNVGNAILYETVLTVLEIEADSGLRVMAINILGKFLSNRDNNIRYVALHTLNKVVGIDTNAVQRHRNIILDCLRDGDISIRRRALELSYALINESNVRIMIRELLAFLEVADNEFKLGITTQVCLAAERFAPNKRWHIDTVLRVLKLAGNYVREEALAGFIRLVAHTPELQAYTASKLYSALHSDISQESLTLAAVWIIGEYGDALIESGLVEEEVAKPVTDTDLVDLLETVLNSPYVNNLSRQFVLTALTKLSARGTTSAAQKERICELLGGYTTSTTLEIQQRAVEYINLFNQTDVRSGVLEQMPAPELKVTVMGTVSENRTVGSTRADTDSLLDLDGDASQNGGTPVPLPKTQNTQDLLADIFGTSSEPAEQPAAQPAVPTSKSVNDILGLFGSTTPTNGTATPPTAANPYASPTATANPLFSLAAAAPPAQQAPAPQQTPSVQRPQLQSYPAFDMYDLKISLTPQVSAARPGIVNILARFQNSGAVPISNVNFQAAVPKTQQLQMLPMSNQTVSPGVVETQQLRVMAPPGAQVRLRLRVGFTVGSQNFQEQSVDTSYLPSVLYRFPVVLTASIAYITFGRICLLYISISTTVIHLERHTMLRSTTKSLLLLLLFSASATALHFYLDAGERRCFIEELPSETIVEAHYRAQEWDEKLQTYTHHDKLGVQVNVEEMDTGHSVVKTRGPPEGKFTFTSHEAGDHSICLGTNYTAGWFSSRHIRMYLDINVGAAKHDVEQDRAHVGDVAQRLRDLNSKLEDIRREQQYQREREAAFRNLSEATNSRAAWYTIMQIVVLLATCAWQMRHLTDLLAMTSDTQLGYFVPDGLGYILVTTAQGQNLMFRFAKLVQELYEPYAVTTCWPFSHLARFQKV
ncbi:clathrin associated protein complex large subunit [Tulasnella sp. 403]|nr:clathrin associated protein complex large subunit [Tulasnella sp. 403]